LETIERGVLALSGIELLPAHDHLIVDAESMLAPAALDRAVSKILSYFETLTAGGATDQQQGVVWI
jgi:hypothetical protein